MKEIFAGPKEIRPGRYLFVREILLGAVDESQENADIAVKLQFFCQHGSCATEAQFHPFLRSLDSLLLQRGTKQQELVKCILYDMVGCGQSPVIAKWEAYCGEELQQDLGAVVEQHTDPLIPLVFAAHSFGPNLLIHWLNKLPKPMTNLSGFVFLGASIRADTAKPYPDRGHPIFMLPTFVLKLLQDNMTKDFVERAIHPSHEDLKQACLKGSNQNDMFMVKAYYRQTKWATSEELVLAVSDKPLLQIHGISDQIIHMECARHLVSQLSANSRAEFVIVENASHLLMLEEPQVVGKAVYDFFVKYSFI